MPIDQDKINNNTHQIGSKETDGQRKLILEASKVEDDGNKWRQGHNGKIVDKNLVLRMAIAFGCSSEHIEHGIRNYRKCIQRYFGRREHRKSRGNRLEIKKGTNPEHNREEACNKDRHPERFHQPLVQGATTDIILRQIAMQALVKSQHGHTAKGQYKKLCRNVSTKNFLSKNTCNNNHQHGASNLEERADNGKDCAFYEKFLVVLNRTRRHYTNLKNFHESIGLLRTDKQAFHPIFYRVSP